MLLQTLTRTYCEPEAYSAISLNKPGNPQHAALISRFIRYRDLLLSMVAVYIPPPDIPHRRLNANRYLLVPLALGIALVCFFSTRQCAGPSTTTANTGTKGAHVGMQHQSSLFSDVGGCSQEWSGLSSIAQLGLQHMKQSVSNITMLSDARRQNVIDLTHAAIARKLPGDILEAGVWQGGASILMKAVLTAHCSSKHIWACDSYQGLPPLTQQDAALEEEQAKPMDAAGSYAFPGGVQTVKKNFRDYGLLDDRVHLVAGYFNDTLPMLTLQRGPKQLAILRMDGDMYSSTMDILENMYDRVVPGGFVIIDDYGYWPQCKKAVQDFFKLRGESHVLNGLHVIDDTGVWFEKPSTAPPPS